MKSKILSIITLAGLLFFPDASFGAVAPTLNTAANFALFSSAGAVTNAGSLFLTRVTGHIGAAPASITGFGNVDGVLYQGGGVFNTATIDVQAAYDEMNLLTPDFIEATPMGGGTILTAGVHSVTNAAIALTGDLILDAQGVSGAVFIFQLQGDFNISANAKVKLINGAQACNVFWKVEGVVTMGGGNNIKGTIIANNSAINMLIGGDTLEGRALAINGAVGVHESFIYKPIGCASPILTGPSAPVLLTTECYALFSTIGPVADDFASFLTGDVGTDGSSDLTTGFDPLKVTGTIHPIPDGSTDQCGIDLTGVYNGLVALAHDIELMSPTLFGHNLILTPHTYLLASAVTFTDTVYLDGQGNPDAIFIFKVSGAFDAGVNSQVKLINGTQAKNVYWKLDGAVDLGVNSIFNGTMIVAGAINLQTGTRLNGRALTINGAVSTFAVNIVMPTTCAPVVVTVAPMNLTVCTGSSASFSVTATGVGLTYKWRKGNVDLINAGNVSGVNTSTLTINPVSMSDAALDYNVVISGTFLPNDTSANMALTVNAIPSVNSVSSQTVCNGSATTGILFSGPISGTTYNWMNNNTSIGLGASGSGDINSFTAISSGTLTSMATTTVTPIANGCTGSSITFTITVKPTTAAPVANSNSPVCSGNTINLSTTTVVGATYSWTGPNGFVSASQNPTLASVTVAMSGTYSLTVSTGSGCGSSIGTTTVVVNQTPVAVASSNSPVCTGTSVNLTAQTVTGGSYTWTSVNGYSSSVQNPVILSASTADAGTYSLTVSVNGCTSAPSTVTVVVNTCGVTADLKVVKTVDNNYPVVGSSIVFTIVVTNNGPDNATGVIVTDILQNGYSYVSSTTSGTYEPLTGIFTIGNLTNGTSEILTITATVNSAGTYTNTATVDGNEPDVNLTDNVSSVVTYPTDFFIPEGFSPNGDGINDFVVIRGIGNYPGNSIVIFNRWGNKVFEANPYANTWDGKATMGLTVGGDELPTGTYFYVLDLGDGSAIYKGTIYLNR